MVADLSGDSLRAVLEGEPSLLKVSDEELERDGWADSREKDDVLRGIERLHDAGARGVVVSRGAETDDRQHQRDALRGRCADCDRRRRTRRR